MHVKLFIFFPLSHTLMQGETKDYKNSSILLHLWGKHFNTFLNNFHQATKMENRSGSNNCKNDDSLQPF